MIISMPPFANVPIAECGEPLIDLAEFDFVLEPAYYAQGLHSEKRMFLRGSTAQKLAAVQEQLQPHRFKIWDGFRTREVQTRLFERFREELVREHPDWSEEAIVAEATKYVNKGSDERIIPPHLTGGTIDLCLVDASGEELSMGTGFDHFGGLAHTLYFEENDIDLAIRNNRRLLRKAMTSAGFYAYPFEWWHFEYGTQAWALHYGKPHALYGAAPVS